MHPGSRVSPTMAPKNRSEEEVQALVGAVKEHKKFKQLACYSIEALSKNLALPNTRWREYIDLAIDADAPQGHSEVATVDHDLTASAECHRSRGQLPHGEGRSGKERR